MVAKLRKTANRPLQSARVIVCEGSDEFDILCWVRRTRCLGDEVLEVINAGGRANLPTELDLLRFQSGGSNVQLVAVVLDAEDRSAADQVLLGQLSAVALQHSFSLQLHVLPAADEAGALETLVRKHADASSPSATCADAWEACLAPAVDARTTAQKDKAWGHVWLAGQGAFHSRLGHALANNADVRERLPAVIQHFETLLDQVLSAPLN